jgi:GxxExxY protein
MDRCIELAQDIWSSLGPGYSERVYHNAFEIALREDGFSYESERILPVSYRGHNVGNLRADLIVAGQFILELKSTSRLKDEFRNQIKNYMKLTGLKAGMLINFPDKSGPLEFEKFEPPPYTEEELMVFPWLAMRD